MICNKCFGDKPLELFRKQTINNTYFLSCNACQAKQAREKYALNKALGIKYVKPNAKRTMKHYRIRKYGITVEDYEAMVLKTEGCCYICDSPPPPTKSNSIDHDHKTGKVRGILCHRCNTALGLLEDSVATLKRAITYLS